MLADFFRRLWGAETKVEQLLETIRGLKEQVTALEQDLYRLRSGS